MARNNSAKIVDRSQGLETYMLPSNFSDRSAFIQRMYFIIVVFLTSFAIGYAIYTIMGDGKEPGVINLYNLSSSLGQNSIFVYNWAIEIALIPVGLFISFWARTRAGKITIFEFFGFLLPSLSMIIGFTMMTNIDLPTDPDNTASFKDLLFIMGIMQIMTVILPAIYTLVLNIARTKIFGDAKYRSLGTLPGALIAGVGSFIQYLIVDINKEVDFIISLLSFAPIAIGIFVIAIGVLMTLGKSTIKTENSIWKNYRYIGALPSMATLGALTGVAIRFSFDTSLDGFILYVTLLNILFLAMLGVHLWFRARIKNITRTNPVHNEIIIKAWVTLPIIICLLFIQLSNTLEPNVKDHGVRSYALVFYNSIIIIIGLVLIHFSNTITYVKYFKTSIFGTILGLLIICGITLSISLLPESGAVFRILANQYIVLLLVVAPFFDILSLFGTISYIVFDTTKTTQKIKKEEQNIEKRSKELVKEFN